MIVDSKNLIFMGVSGSLGDFTYSQRNGKTVRSKRRRKTQTPPTEKQIAARELFKMASQQALLILGDPTKKTFYEAMARRKDASAYALAVKDAYHLLSY